MVGAAVSIPLRSPGALGDDASAAGKSAVNAAMDDAGSNGASARLSAQRESPPPQPDKPGGAVNKTNPIPPVARNDLL